MKNITDYIQQWANTYKDDMQNNIMPFWIKYGLDRVNGGISVSYTHLRAHET